MKPSNPHKEAYEQQRFTQKMWEHEDEHCIYDNRRGTLLMRVSVFLFVGFVLCIYYSMTMGNDEFSSELSGYFWRSVFIIAPAILLGCMVWLSSKYVLRLDLLPRQQVKIRTWHILGLTKEKVWNADEFQQQVKYHKGQMATGASPIVNAPYLMLKSTKRESLLVDMQGDFPKGINTVLALAGSNILHA